MPPRETDSGAAGSGWIDPFEDGPHVPYWRTEYYLKDDPRKLRYEFGSHADALAGHLDAYLLKAPADAQRVTSYMVITRNGHHVHRPDTGLPPAPAPSRL